MNALAGRRSLGVLVALGLFSGALWLLHHELGHYDLHAILGHAQGTARSRLIEAFGATAASYLLLTFYDVLALRHVRHPLPYGRTALTSFTSYVASHNLGLAGLAGSAIRFRLYSAWGLAATEIAEVVAFCGLSFWVGFLFLGGVVFTLAPVELPAALHAALHTTRPFGFLLLLPALAFLLWTLLSRRPLRIGKWCFSPPSPRLFALQLPLGLLDWLLAALVLYLLLPPGHGVTFVQVLGVFLASQTLGMVSHVPAGLGVFETACVVLLPGDVSTPELLGALLVYRAVYYLVPLLLGGGLLLGTEAFLWRESITRLGKRLAPLGSAVVPGILAFATSSAGAVLLVTGALPAAKDRIHLLHQSLPLPVTEVSHFLGSLAGAWLLVIGRGLLRRIDAAWWLAALALTAGIVFALLRGLDYEEAAILAVSLALLLPYRRLFYRQASLLHLPWRAEWILALGLVLGSTVWLGLLSYRHVEYSSDLWWHFAARGDAPRFLRATAGAFGLVACLGLARLLRPVRRAPAPPSASDLETVTSILKGEPDTIGHLALVGDKELLFDDSRRSFVMYAVRGSSWIALGDPVGGPPEVRRELVWRFRELAEHAGGRAAFYQVGRSDVAWYAEVGFGLLKLGEEARVDLTRFSLEGHERKGLRSNLHRLEREGHTFEILAAEGVAARLSELRAVSDRWLAEKRTREKGFSLGSFQAEYLQRTPVAVVVREGRVVAFANLLLGAPGGELSVDLMRYSDDVPGSPMDYLFARALEWGAARGYRWFSLGVAPLSGLERRASAPLWNRLAHLVGEHGERFYNFQGLRQYKGKFDPFWEPRYLATHGGLWRPGTLIDLSALISGGLRGAVAR